MTWVLVVDCRVWPSVCQTPRRRVYKSNSRSCGRQRYLGDPERCPDSSLFVCGWIACREAHQWRHGCHTMTMPIFSKRQHRLCACMCLSVSGTVFVALEKLRIRWMARVDLSAVLVRSSIAIHLCRSKRGGAETAPTIAATGEWILNENCRLFLEHQVGFSFLFHCYIAYYDDVSLFWFFFLFDIESSLSCSCLDENNSKKQACCKCQLGQPYDILRFLLLVVPFKLLVRNFNVP